MQKFNEWLDGQFKSKLYSFVAGRIGKDIPGNTPEQKLNSALDIINKTLDMAGIADPSGIADGSNAIIYAVRAAATKDPALRNGHLTNAVISLVSVIPFGDLAKALKMRHFNKSSTAVSVAGKALGTYANFSKEKRIGL